MLLQPLNEHVNSIARAQEVARRAAAERLEVEIVTSDAIIDVPRWVLLPSVGDVDRAFDWAASTASPDLRLTGEPDGSSAPLEFRLPWRTVVQSTSDIPVPNFGAIYSDSVAATTLTHAERLFPELADFMDDLACAQRCAVEATLVRGHLVSVPRTRMSGCTVLVLPLGGPIRVNGQGTLTTTLVQGQMAVAHGSFGLETDGPGVAAMLIECQQMGMADVLARVANKARYWPRLRGDVPYDPRQPAQVYGLEQPSALVPLVAEELAKLLDERTFLEATAWWEANLTPVLRARSQVARLLVAPTGDLEARGRFVGGIGFLAKDSGVYTLAAGSALFLVHESALALVERLASNEWFAMRELQAAFGSVTPEPDLQEQQQLLRSLLALGLADLRSPDPGV